MASFLDEQVSLNNLSGGWRETLTQVPDYPLDYNIFLSRGIENAREDQADELVKFRKSVIDSIPEDYGGVMFNGLEKQTDGSLKLEKTTTALLQNRLLKLLILERHRRDMLVLNRILAADPNNVKHINYVELKEPLKYEIKSPIYKTFEEDTERYQSSFNKFSLLQNIEYEFEHTIDEDGDYQRDEDLLEAFCTEDVMNFDKTLEANRGKDIDNLVADSEIGRVLLPLAAQALFLQNKDVKDVELGLETN